MTTEAWRRSAFPGAEIHHCQMQSQRRNQTNPNLKKPDLTVSSANAKCNRYVFHSANQSSGQAFLMMQSNTDGYLGLRIPAAAVTTLTSGRSVWQTSQLQADIDGPAQQQPFHNQH